MCNRCKSNIEDIRQSIIDKRLPGQISLGMFEVGCWACDGEGNPTHKPFLPSDNSPAWNVYFICRTVEETAVPIKASTNMRNCSVQFISIGGFQWDIAIDASWSYSQPDLWHEYAQIKKVPNCPHTEENAYTSFIAKTIRKYLNFQISIV